MLIRDLIALLEFFSRKTHPTVLFQVIFHAVEGEGIGVG